MTDNILNEYAGIIRLLVFVSVIIIAYRLGQENS